VKKQTVQGGAQNEESNIRYHGLGYVLSSIYGMWW
jgi:hypothetical protein